MIQYETEESTFYKTNNDYCNLVEQQLIDAAYSFSGYCNSFGYEIEANKHIGNIHYSIKFEKHQTTQNGVIFLVDANDYEGSSFKITGLDGKLRLTIGKSRFKRLFTNYKYKSISPSPYFIYTNLDNDLSTIIEINRIFTDNNIASLTLKGGALNLRVHEELLNPVLLIDSIGTLLKAVDARVKV